jgi:sulfur dioxygenase
MKGKKIFRQLIDKQTSTYTYFLASGIGREAIIIDPVDELAPVYLQLISELDLKLVAAIDTHTHADHISARCKLRNTTNCAAVMGEQTKAQCVSIDAKENETLNFDGIVINPIYTPGHTDDSYSFVIDDSVFTGDALFIHGTGRTDFQNGSSEQLYDSITQKLFSLPEDTTVYPGHDYNGNTSSSIFEEKRFNPRLAGRTRQEFIEIMSKLDLPRPNKIDVAVPSNLQCRCD